LGTRHKENHDAERLQPRALDQVNREGIGLLLTGDARAEVVEAEMPEFVRQNEGLPGYEVAAREFVCLFVAGNIAGNAERLKYRRQTAQILIVLEHSDIVGNCLQTVAMHLQPGVSGAQIVEKFQRQYREDDPRAGGIARAVVAKRGVGERVLAARRWIGHLDGAQLAPLLRQ
jgi:hypothetical protein